MTKVWQERFGNASSVHREGQAAREALESARRQVARSLGAKPAEIAFTSGGTESNNLAIFGAIFGGMARRADGMLEHVITTAVEHPSVLEVCRRLQGEGVNVTFLAVDRNGLVDPGDVRRAMRLDTRLVSVMHANNETGVIQPVAAIAAIVREARERGQQVYLHCDGVQAPGRIPVNVNELGVDLYSISAHKIYGPKGVGALFARKGTAIGALQFGGRQERGLRPGTENVAGAVALARALECFAINGLGNDSKVLHDVKRLRDEFEAKLLRQMENIIVNASDAERLPNTSNICFPGVDGNALVIALDMKGFAVSSGSACSSGSVEPSHVLLAMGGTQAEARSCVRFSLGLGNTAEEVNALADAVIASVGQLRGSRRRGGVRKDEYAPV
jgi:cysteine desulfurase